MNEMMQLCLNTLSALKETIKIVLDESIANEIYTNVDQLLSGVVSTDVASINYQLSSLNSVLNQNVLDATLKSDIISLLTIFLMETPSVSGLTNIVNEVNKLVFYPSSDRNELEEKLKCLVEVLGKNVGDVLRCMVQSEIQSHVQRIEQLQATLNGSICK